MRTAALLMLLLGGGALGGCAARLVPDLVRQAAESQSPGSATQIVVLKSSASPLFDQIVDSFLAQQKSAVTVYTMREDTDPNLLLWTLRQLAPSLIFTLGTKAAILVHRELPEVPLLFTMVVDYQSLHLEDPQVMGIAQESSPSMVFSQFKLVLPNTKKILIMYAPDKSGALVERARVELARFGFELVAVAVDSARDVTAAYEAHKKEVDCVWMQNDSTIVQPATFDFLRRATVRDHLPLVTTVSDRFAEAGALMAASVDFAALGAQAANMATVLIEDHVPASRFGVQAPIGARLVVNFNVAQQIGLQIPSMVMPFISRVIGNVTAPAPASP